MKKLAITALALAVAVTLAACAQLDVLGTASIDSFSALLDAMSNAIQPTDTGWTLSAPDGTTRFILGTNSSAHMETAVQPFLDAGLDVQKLPEGMMTGDQLVLGFDLNAQDAAQTPIAAYEALVRLAPGRIGYHAALDHYGVDLDGGMLEWAKDMTTNDKDLVFVLDPTKLIAAGVDPEKVQGWAYAAVKVMDASGKTKEVFKFLKPFDVI